VVERTSPFTTTGFCDKGFVSLMCRLDLIKSLFQRSLRQRSGKETFEVVKKRKYDLTETRIFGAAAFLLDIEDRYASYTSLLLVFNEPKTKHLLALLSLVVLILSLARVQPEDMEKCSDLPLSVQIQ